MNKSVKKAWIVTVHCVWTVMWVVIFQLAWKEILPYFTNWSSEAVLYSSWVLAIIGGIIMLTLNYKDVTKWSTRI